MPFRKLFVLITAIILVSTTVAYSQEAPEDGEVRFIVLGDSQFGNVWLFDRMVYEADMLRPQYVLQVGDMIQGYKHDRVMLRDEWRRYKKQIAPLTAPFWPVPGNHDVVTDESEEIYGEIWGQDRYYYSFDYGPVHNIVIDTYYQDYDDVIPEFMLEWLKEDVEAYAEANGGLASEELASKSIFLYMHSPLWRYDDDTPGRKSWTQALDILEGYPVELVVGGHTHEFVWQEERGIPHLVINSSGGMGGSQPMVGFLQGMLHISVLDGNMQAAYIQSSSVFPIDSVGNDERSLSRSVRVGSQSIRIPGYTGGPLAHSIEVDVRNNFKEERPYHLEWKFPRGSRVSAEPREMWLDIPTSETKTVEFRLIARQEPTPEELPYLHVTATNMMRTGYVSRDAEEKIKEERAAAEGKSGVYTSNVYLEKMVEFSADWPLFLPPVINVPRIDGGITVDGSMGEDVWNEAATVTDFVYASGEDVEVDTEVRILYDDDNLYVISLMEEPNAEEMTANAEAPIAMTWNDDDFELFLDPGMTQSRFYRFFENYAGTRFTARPLGSDPRYIEDSPHQSAIQIGEDQWVLEIAIPWSELGRNNVPDSSEQWGIFFWRHRPQGHETTITWNVPGGGAYNAARYGVLAFE